RNLPAVEGLGSCDVVATDKTGTLTRNELTVEHVVAGGTRYDLEGVGYAPRGRLRGSSGGNQALERLLRAVSLANEGALSLREGSEGEWEWSGDPTDVALLALAVKAGADPTAIAQDHPTAATLPFEPERGFHASWHRRGADG